MAQMEKLKVSSATWNSDTNPNGLTAFISQLDSMARACKGGPQLINFLDQKLKRKLRKVATVPSFISGDPDFLDFDPSLLLAPASTSFKPGSQQHWSSYISFWSIWQLT